MTPLRVGVIGAGYWGPNLVRNLQTSPETDLRWVCDLAVERAALAVGRNSTVRVTDSLDRVLADPEVDAMAVATPPATHLEVVLACLDAGKHVLVEKPLAASVAEGRKLVDAAASRGLVLMCDHTYCYTPAVQKMRELVSSGTLGDVQYVDSVRINLGLVQRDVDVLWDLGPHDLSILDFVLPPDCWPRAVAAHGADPIGTGRIAVGYLTLSLGGGAIAHVHVNWLSPTKIRTMIVGGSRRTLVWDDLSPTQRLRVFDRGVDLVGIDPDDTERRREMLVAYRSGDMIAPALPETEALQSVVAEFVGAVREDRQPLTDGWAGLRVLRLLEAASASLEAGGVMVALRDPSADQPRRLAAAVGGGA